MEVVLILMVGNMSDNNLKKDKYKRSINDVLISNFNNFRYSLLEPLKLKRERKKYSKHYKNLNNPKISICIPTFNRAELLMERAVESVFSQTYKNFELIIVGDHCTDNTSSCSQYDTQLGCIAETGCFWMGDHCMPGSACADPIAENFNPMAEAMGASDNSECIYSPFLEFGCTYPGAINFSGEAHIDDGSCQFSYNDVNGDGIVDILDIVIILSELIEPE